MSNSTKIGLNKKIRMVILNLLLIVILFGLILFNKSILRPYFSETIWLSFLTGSFPNFIAAYILGLAIVNPVLHKKPKYGKDIIYLSSLLIFAILSFEEFLPIWNASTHFDALDIIATGMGSIATILTYELIPEKNKIKKRIKKRKRSSLNDIRM